MACGLVDLGRQGTKMKIIFVRHGEPDYSMLDKLEDPQLYSGFGRDLAPFPSKKSFKSGLVKQEARHFSKIREDTTNKLVANFFFLSFLSQKKRLRI